MVKLQNFISRKSVPPFQRQPFADVLQSRCSKKLSNIHRKTPALESLFNKVPVFFFFFFSIWVFFHEPSLFTGQQRKGEGISLTPLYHFHPLHRQLDISLAIVAERSPLHIASSRTRTGNIWFPSASR